MLHKRFKNSRNIFSKNPPSIEVIENSLGGTPTENRSTLIPTDLAAIKCPNSWMVTKTPRSIMKA